MAFSFSIFPNIQEILQVPGFLYWGTTDLSAEATWGTLLGYCEKGVFFEPRQEYAEFTEEETGEEIKKILYLGASPRVSVILKNYNATALGRLFPGIASVATVKFPGAIKAGHDLVTYNGRLLFVPDDQDNNPCFLLQSAWPHLLKTAKLQFSHSNRLLFPCTFTGKRVGSSTDGIAYIGAMSGAILR